MPPKAPNPPPPPDVKAIKSGNLPTQGQGRDNLLSSIQKGTSLKKVPENEKKEPPPVNPKMEGKKVDNKKTTNVPSVPKPKIPETKTETKTDTKSGFVPTGNSTLDELQKKRLAKKEEVKVETKPVPTVPVRREPPTVPKKEEGKKDEVKKEPPSVPVRREAPKPPKRDETTKTPVVEKSETEKSKPPVPVRREPPRPPKKEDVKVETKTTPTPIKTESVKTETVVEKPPVKTEPVIEKPKPSPPSKEVKPTAPTRPQISEPKPKEKPTPPVKTETVVEKPVEIKQPEINENNIEQDGKFKFKLELPNVPEFKNVKKVYKGNNPKFYGFINVSSSKEEVLDQEWENIEAPQRKAPSIPNKPKPPVPENKPQTPTEKYVDDSDEVVIQLNQKIKKLIDEERFEECSSLRDMIKKIKETKKNSSEMKELLEKAKKL